MLEGFVFTVYVCQEMLRSFRQIQDSLQINNFRTCIGNSRKTPGKQLQVAEIANYAFTTLEPNLGIVEVRDHKSFVMADIPGIIEGAHEGRGLGTRFLRHIERNSVLLFMIPADSDDLKRDYAVLLGELTQYNPELLDKQRLLAITKCDMLDDELIEEMKSHLPEGVPSVFISSVSGLNIPRLKDMLWDALQP